MIAPPELIADLRIRAGNLERYPFESATMVEAGQLAANVLRNLANEYENGVVSA